MVMGGVVPYFGHQFLGLLLGDAFDEHAEGGESFLLFLILGTETDYGFCVGSQGGFNVIP